MRQAEKLSKEARENDIKNAFTSGAIKGVEICDFFNRALRHIREGQARIGSLNPRDLWEGISDTVQSQELPAQFTELEAAAFVALKEAELYTHLTELRRAILTERDFWRQLLELNAVLERETRGRGTFSGSGNVLERGMHFVPDKDIEITATLARLRSWSVNYIIFIVGTQSRTNAVLENLSIALEKNKIGFTIG